jgi:hypothetical protein
MSAVPRPIVAIVIKNVYLRPTRSPMCPKTMAPSGRTPNPAPKVARLARSCAVSLPFGKKRPPKNTARLP